MIYPTIYLNYLLSFPTSPKFLKYNSIFRNISTNYTLSSKANCPFNKWTISKYHIFIMKRINCCNIECSILRCIFLINCFFGMNMWLFLLSNVFKFLGKHLSVQTSTEFIVVLSKFDVLKYQNEIKEFGRWNYSWALFNLKCSAFFHSCVQWYILFSWARIFMYNYLKSENSIAK